MVATVEKISEDIKDLGLDIIDAPPAQLVEAIVNSQSPKR
jgi:hypothetical protein